MENNAILTISELSEYLKISKSLVRNMVANGEIPFFRLHRRILFKFDLIQEWLNEQS